MYKNIYMYEKEEDYRCKNKYKEIGFFCITLFAAKINLPNKCGNFPNTKPVKTTIYVMFLIHKKGQRYDIIKSKFQ